MRGPVASEPPRRRDAQSETRCPDPSSRAACIYCECRGAPPSGRRPPSRAGQGARPDTGRCSRARENPNRWLRSRAGRVLGVRRAEVPRRLAGPPWGLVEIQDPVLGSRLAGRRTHLDRRGLLERRAELDGLFARRVIARPHDPSVAELLGAHVGLLPGPATAQFLKLAGDTPIKLCNLE